MENFAKNVALWVIIGLLLIALFNLFQNPSGRGPQANLAFSDFLAEVDNGRVRYVTIQGSTITGHFSDGRSFSTYAPEDPSLVSRLSDRGVRITAAPVDDSVRSLIGILVPWFFPALLLAAPLLRGMHGLSSSLKVVASMADETSDGLARLVARVEDFERRQHLVEQRLADLGPGSWTSPAGDPT